jgi:hypothetical protein
MRIRLQALLIAVLAHSGEGALIKMSLLPARLHFAVGSYVFESVRSEFILADRL